MVWSAVDCLVSCFIHSFQQMRLLKVFGLFHHYVDKLGHLHQAHGRTMSSLCSALMAGRCERWCGHLSIFGFHFPPTSTHPPPFASQLVPPASLPADVSRRRVGWHQIGRASYYYSVTQQLPHTREASPTPPFNLFLLAFSSATILSLSPSPFPPSQVACIGCTPQ